MYNDFFDNNLRSGIKALIKIEKNGKTIIHFYCFQNIFAIFAFEKYKSCHMWKEDCINTCGIAFPNKIDY